MDLSANPNTHWMTIFVDELARNGLTAVCIAPGSRSTPLTLAFAAHTGIRIYRHLDERSAGYFALGLALASSRPVALVCTSGTAAANFHPAIIEAYYSHVPLLVLTADRPAELRGSGANQTIDQIKMYGDHVRWSIEVPTPQAGAPEVVLRHLRTLAARAYAAADGVVRGPVHLNFPFRKPLEPSESLNGGVHSNHIEGPGTNDPWGQMTRPLMGEPYTLIGRGRMTAGTQQIAAVAEKLIAHPRGLIICGPECPDQEFPAEVTRLAELCGYPILADPLSNLRHGPHAAGGAIISGYPLWLSAASEHVERPQMILRFGTVSTSNALASYVEDTAPAAHIHIREDGEWADDLHITHETIQVDPVMFCTALSEELVSRNYQPQTRWLELWCMLEETGFVLLDKAMSRTPFFDGAAVHHVLAALLNDMALFVGNSMPVRHVDSFDRPDERRITVYGNRGASGIDGNVSTALGLAASNRHKRVVAIIGDITFYHDMNGLLAVRQHGLDNVTFIVLNNDGGSIFHRLPIAKHDPPFTDLFLTPHGLTFDHAAAMYGLVHRRVNTEMDLAEALKDAFDGQSGPFLIEVHTDSQADYRHMKAVVSSIVTGFQSIESPAG